MDNKTATPAPSTPLLDVVESSSFPTQADCDRINAFVKEAAKKQTELINRVWNRHKEYFLETGTWPTDDPEVLRSGWLTVQWPDDAYEVPPTVH
jgi:hypothetical protein